MSEGKYNICDSAYANVESYLTKLPDAGKFESHEKYIDIQSGTAHIRINLMELIYAEVYNRKTIIHTKTKDIEYYGQLSALEKIVGKEFYRIHRSYLVNMKYIERYDKANLILVNGDTVPIARRGYEGFLKAYMEYSRTALNLWVD